MLDRMIDRFIERERVLLGDRFREFNDALRDGIQPTQELTAIVEADPETQRLYRVYWQIAKWREYIENAIPRTRRRRAT